MGLSTNEVEYLNPPDDVYFSQANAIRDIFNNDYENVLMPNAIKNARVLFFYSDLEIETNSNCAFVDGNLTLDTSSITQFDSMDDIGTYYDENTQLPSANGDNIAPALSYGLAKEDHDVKNFAETVTYVKDTDYTIVYSTMVITRIDDSSMVAVIPDGGNTSTGVIAHVPDREFELSDSTNLDYKLEITTGGGYGTAEFRWSDDGGSTWDETGIVIQSNGWEYDLNNGVKLKFTGGSPTYVVDDFWTWDCTGSSTAIPKGENLSVFYYRQTGGTWEEDSGFSEDNGYFLQNTNASHKSEGTGSMKIAIDDGQNPQVYAVHKTISGEDWSTRNYIRIWIKSTNDHGIKPEIAFYFKDGTAARTSDLLTIPYGSTELTFDIGSLGRTNVTEWGFKVKQKTSDDFDVYIDDVRYILETTTYYTSGYVETSTEVFTADIEEVFITEKMGANMPETGSRIVKLSLDGTNWHSFEEGDFEEWISVSGWTEMTVKNKLRIRIDLANSEDSTAAEYDDVMVSYKFET